MVAGTWFQWRDLQIRIASAVVLIPLVIAAVRLGGWWYAGLIAVLAALMAKEWTRLVHAGSATQFLLHAAGGIAATILPALSVPALAAATILGLWISSLWLAHLSGAPFSLWSLAGIPYLALPAASLVLLRSDESWGFQAVMLVLLVVWVADTAAYFAGRVIGGPRLAPTLSPNKTWAGFSGAIAGGALAALAAGAWSNVARLWPLMLLGGLLAMIEQAGDLFESALKRWAGAKDSGQMIPGHGGVLDRVDGLAAAAVAAAVIGLAHGDGKSAAAGLLLW